METRKSSDSAKPVQSNESKITPKQIKENSSPRLGNFFRDHELKPIDPSPLALAPTPRDAGIGPTPPPPPATSPSS